MKAMPTQDIAFGDGMIRADGRVIHNIVSVRSKVARAVEGAMGLLYTATDCSGS